MQPLDGLLVVAVEQAVAAPLCTARLAAAGARVIKIERGDGDFARGYDTAASGESSYFTWLNQGKESVCLNFKEPHGAELLRAMLQQADVLVQNLAPGALARTGFGFDELHKLNPRLITCNISGYGATGDVASKKAYDLLVQAESGLISVSGDADAPGRIGVSVCDIGAGMCAHSAVLEALIKRGMTGLGEEVAVSLFDVAAEWMMVPYIHAHYGAGAPTPVGLRHPSIAPYGAFACNDQRLTLLSIQNEREWQRLCNDVLRSPAMLQQAMYSDNNARVKNRPALEADITAITMTMSSAEFQQRLSDASIAYGSINTAKDLQQHPALRMQQYRTSDNKALELPAYPAYSSLSTHTAHTGASAAEGSHVRSPKIGEHTDAIVAEFLG